MTGVGRRIAVEGTVQGVGFRPWVCRLARRLDLAGRVRNDGGGVVVEVSGAADRVDALVGAIESGGPPGARVERVRVEDMALTSTGGFHIVASQPGGGGLPLAPDLATCPECVDELFRAGRRHGYAFTSCTDCGPRFTIARALPFDRARTAMAAFRLCDACAREFASPDDRRFHAQTQACPRCGPRLELRDASGAPLATPDPIREAAVRIARGEIVAVKGLGGFHLACDATREAAVARLRRRKRRERKPFAVMVPDVAAARKLGRLDTAECALLASPERPIVLVRARAEAGLAASVAPDCPLVGLLLPYAPLHHLLLAATARPLVMTSGNPSSEPIVHLDAEAPRRLAGVADAFLGHDRAITVRCDDSVARVVDGAPMLLRRSRGFVPRPLRLPRALARPVLACGAHLKSAVCLAAGDRAWLGPHVGDLESLEAVDAFAESVSHLEALLGIAPEVFAHDLHPDYASTRYARERAPHDCVAVQHHHAHVASVLAERGLGGPVLGLAWDGSGLGPDATAWGGELLLADATGFERLASFRPVRLAGGDRAVRHVWRLALAALEDAYEGDPPLDALAMFERVPAPELRAVRRLLASGRHTALAHGVGRWFDLVGALALARPRASHEGDVAAALDWATPSEAGAPPYPFAVETVREPWQVDLRPLLRAVVDDVLAARPAAWIGARFHACLVAAGEALVRRAAARTGRLPVVLCGGCFQNPHLAHGLPARLRPDFEVVLPRAVPPGDGGLALGQAWVAAAAREG